MVRGDAGGQMADLINGAIGEASMFHDTFGYHAQGVVETTAVQPQQRGERVERVVALDPVVRDAVRSWIWT